MTILKKTLALTLVFIMSITGVATVQILANTNDDWALTYAYDEVYNLGAGVPNTYPINEGLRVVGAEGMRALSSEHMMATEIDGIVMSTDGIYAMEVETIFGIEYVPMGKLEIDFADEYAVRNALQRNDLTPGMIEDILTIQQEILDGLAPDGITMTIFCQSLLSYSDMRLLGGNPIYVTFNGMQMRTTITNFTGRSTGMQYIQRGVGTRNVAISLAHIILEVAGAASGTVGILTSGITVWQHFLNIIGQPASHIVTSPGDYLQVGIRFDEVRRRTYGTTLGNWVLGLTTQQIRIYNIASRQHYMVNNVGRNVDTNSNHNVTVISPNFHDPWALAHQRMFGLRPPGPLVQSVRVRIAHTTLDLR